MLEPNLRIWSMEKSGYVSIFYFFVHSRVCCIAWAHLSVCCFCLPSGSLSCFLVETTWGYKRRCRHVSLRYNLYLPLPLPRGFFLSYPLARGEMVAICIFYLFFSFIRSIGFGIFFLFLFLSFYLFSLVSIFFFPLLSFPSIPYFEAEGMYGMQ